MKLALALVLAGALALAGEASAQAGAKSDWGHYGGDAGGQRFSALTQITPENVNDLKVAWHASTGELESRADVIRRYSALETTPILVEDSLVLCSAFNVIIALDPGTGAEKWRFDPEVKFEGRKGNQYTCRGVAYWRDEGASGGTCASRIFMGTADTRVISVDAKTGQRCTGFGQNGELGIDPGMPLLRPGEFQITSAPVVLNGVLIVGSSIGDNARVEAPRGTLRAFDARTGKPRWSFDPIPRDPSAPNASSWLTPESMKAGHANVWAPMSIDEATGLVFVPTSSPSPDFFGGLRPGENRYANSVVALRGDTGEVVWHFQTVHHDVWDYDIPAQPTLATVTYKGVTRPAVLQATKQGLLFTLDRETGLPIIPVEERPVPQNGATGEWLSPTQPFPIAPKALAPDRIKPEDAFGLTPWDRGACRDAIAAARSEGIYTPPSEQGTIVFPFTGGGTNWGGLAFDPQAQTVYVNTSSMMHLIRLIPADNVAAEQEGHLNREISAQRGAPFGMSRDTILSPLGLPCNPPPWGMLHAIDMRDGSIKWQVRIGTTRDLAPLGIELSTGVPNLGGPIVTASGVIFIGATMDNFLRAFDAATGKELWRGRLPAGGQATPMTYQWNGRQYVVIAAGGHSTGGTRIGDSIVAYALP